MVGENPQPGPLADDASAATTLTIATRDDLVLPEQAPVLFRLVVCDRPLEPSWGHPLDVDEVLFVRGPRSLAKRSVDASGQRLVVTVPDAHMSANHARLVRAPEGLVVEDLGSKNGTAVNGERRPRALLQDGDLLELGSTFFLYRAHAWSGGRSDVEGCLTSSCGVSTMVESLGKELGECARIAGSTVPVLVLGESGTGKEMVARAIHDVSGRRGALVAINCAALPESLLEAELFGARKGAFSGAVEDRPGLLRSSHEGTLFLDEIAELPVAAQAALLRVLQEGEVLAVGATRPVRVDLRIVAATHADLERRVAARTFRADLFARLAGFTVRLPPLRERREDMGILIARLLERAAGAMPAPRLSRNAARAILTHAWPLNVRELEKCLSAAVVLAERTILVEHLPDAVQRGADAAEPAAPAKVERTPTRAEDVTSELLVTLFTKHHGSLSAVARELNRERVQIRRWVKHYNIDVARFRAP